MIADAMIELIYVELVQRLIVRGQRCLGLANGLVMSWLTHPACPGKCTAYVRYSEVARRCMKPLR